MKEIFKYSGLFTGWPHNVVPVHNVEALEKNEFGKIIATSLIHGGQPPVCFLRQLQTTWYMMRLNRISVLMICMIILFATS